MPPSSDSGIESNPARGIPAIVFVMIGLFIILLSIGTVALFGGFYVMDEWDSKDWTERAHKYFSTIILLMASSTILPSVVISMCMESQNKHREVLELWSRGKPNACTIVNII